MKRESKRTGRPGPRGSAPGSSGDDLSSTVGRRNVSGAGTNREASKDRAALSRLFAAAGIRNLACGMLLLLVTVIAYLPALNGGLLWDDDLYVTKPALQSFHGLWSIWTDLALPHSIIRCSTARFGPSTGCGATRCPAIT